MVALLAGRPLWAAMMVWKLVSPSPGMLVWMSSTSSSASRIVSASMARSSTASELAPLGGATLTWRIFSEPALMNWVGNWLTRDSEAKNRTPANATTPRAVQRERRANVMSGMYSRTQRDLTGSPLSSTLTFTLSMRK